MSLPGKQALVEEHDKKRWHQEQLSNVQKKSGFTDDSYMARCDVPSGNYLLIDESVYQWLAERMPNLKKAPRKALSNQPRIQDARRPSLLLHSEDGSSHEKAHGYSEAIGEALEWKWQNCDYGFVVWVSRHDPNVDQLWTI
ncbi:hypothetical protein MUCCIDRAFT_114607 [Mucor lusitanicus CBS 277.49]|uniref:Uncharacterized protein n=1 Tax=Mucor lusitanicus CBS 277.49 TaxID=747725 RepID=A0A168I0U7_MUCCL|nr:hypothetical protein MUCCIDRAFT_114607 [Mucor lusitanicus CBS 277.49]